VSLPAWARDARPVGGGCINDAYRVTLADGTTAFVKTRAEASPGEYAAEAAGLRWLAEPGALRTPRVISHDAGHLALEWVPAGALDAAGAEELGRGLALTHAAGAPCFGIDGSLGASAQPGGAGEEGGVAEGAAATFGSLRLPNDPAPDWPQFYGERRLRPLARIAVERGALGSDDAAAVERVAKRLGELCGPAEPPARLHGDLWSGNVMADADGRPWLIDPSCYGGHREIDLAMLRLFGAPSPRVLGAYEEISPPADGWEDRVELFQLLPLLVHVVLFGGSYGAAARRVLARYV
jgi:fructosamine-3-kinase